MHIYILTILLIAIINYFFALAIQKKGIDDVDNKDVIFIALISFIPVINVIILVFLIIYFFCD